MLTIFKPINSQNLNSIKVRQWLEILSGEFIVKLPNNSVNKRGVTTCNNQIINIDQEVDECNATGIDKERRVCMGCNKAERE